MARDLIRDTDVNITTEGRPYLGAPLGSQQYVEGFIRSKLNLWKKAILSLTDIASSQPHAAYAAFTRGLSNLWLFLYRTILNAYYLLEFHPTIWNIIYMVFQ